MVLDKLDYCSSVKNFDAMKDCPNFKVQDLLLDTPHLSVVNIVRVRKAWKLIWINYSYG